MTWVRLAGGEFFMGESAEDKFANDTERPRWRVCVAPFELADFPVTVGEFRQFRPGHEPGVPEDWPAVWVSWEDAVAYCAWLGGGARLPTENEWEYAARAGALTPFPWGYGISPAQANYLLDESKARVGCGHRTPRGAYPPNVWGLFDMLGNVCEWTADLWRPRYDVAPLPGEQRRVVRGGAWDYLPRLLRVSWRDRVEPFTRRDNLGFRLARSQP